MGIDNCECPECGHEFNPQDRVWHVCHQCFIIEGPDEEGHKARGECLRRLGSYIRRYTEEDAKRWQQRHILERRPPMGHDEIIDLMKSLEEGDEIMFKQFNFSDVFLEIVVDENEDGVIKATENDTRNSPWDLRINEDGTPHAQKRNHSESEEIFRLEVFEFHD